MKNFLPLFILLLSISAFSQSDKFYIDISSGLALPMGKYSSQDLTEGSFTEPGGSLLINFNWLAKPPFGLRVLISGVMNPVDVASLGWVRVAADPFLSDVSIRSDPYVALNAMGGVFYEKEIIRKINIQAGINAGVMEVKSPYQLHKPKYFLFGPEYFEITTASDYAFAYQFSLDFEYKIRDSWSLIIHSSYNNAVAEFTYWTANEIRVHRKPINYLLANFGFRLKF
jgi:hypothetical protein